ncbi:MAG: hypothetical protein GX458_11695 [Phyllobacteriaceae bacterium]|nr:hypothetical protein [Phyllobacteriaceae bacterium]
MNKLILAAGLATALFLALQGGSVGRSFDLSSPMSTTAASGGFTALDRVGGLRF